MRRSRLPTAGALDGAAPGVAEGGALIFAEVGLEGAVGVPAGGDGVGGGPEADGQTGEGGRAEGGRLGDGGALDGDAEEIGLPLHEEVVGGGAAVDAECEQGRAGLGAGDVIRWGPPNAPRTLVGGHRF